MSTKDPKPNRLKTWRTEYQDDDGLTEREVEKIKEDVTDLILGTNLTKFSIEVEGEKIWREIEDEADATDEAEATETAETDESADETDATEIEVEDPTETEEIEEPEPETETELSPEEFEQEIAETSDDEPEEVEDLTETVEQDETDETEQTNVEDLWGEDLTELNADEQEDVLAQLTDDEPDEDLPTCYECGETIESMNNGSDHPTCPECGKNPLPPVGGGEEWVEENTSNTSDDVNLNIHGDTSRWDDELKPSEEYLQRIEDGEDIDPEELVPHRITTKSAKWKVLGLLARSGSKLKAGQIEAMLEDTEWQVPKDSIYNALYTLKQEGLIEGEGKHKGNAYTITQLGLDYVTTKNLTTEGHDLAVADRIVNHDTDDTQTPQAAD